jgi:TatD DNase family protein
LDLIDTHCHLDLSVFDADRPAVIDRSRLRGVTRWIVPGVTRQQWDRLLNVCAQNQGAYPAPGLHPLYTEMHRESDLTALADLLTAKREEIVAIGEIGLDFQTGNDDEKRQRWYFEAQLDLAEACGLPLILHVRRAHDQVHQLLRRHRFRRGGVVHCYSGSLQQAWRYLECGFLLGIGGVITWERSRRLQQIVRELPLSAFVVETDAPDIPVFGRPPGRNSPEYLPDILTAFAGHRHEPVDQLSVDLHTNTLAVFPRLQNR